jgi:hypothetical protein
MTPSMSRMSAKPVGKTWNVARYARDDDFVLVTNNASDFRALYASEPLHAALVILIPAVGRVLQQKMFRAALDELATLGERSIGSLRSISTARYVGEFDFRYNNRVGLGVNDIERTEKVAKGAVGKRLTYQRTRQQPEAEASYSLDVSRARPCPFRFG